MVLTPCCCFVLRCRCVLNYEYLFCWGVGGRPHTLHWLLNKPLLHLAFLYHLSMYFAYKRFHFQSPESVTKGSQMESEVEDISQRSWRVQGEHIKQVSAEWINNLINCKANS